MQSSSVLWNGTPLQTTYASSGELTATVPAADIASAGTASITVSNPSPGGGSSNALIFTINNPAPANNVQLTVEDSHGNPIAGAAITDTHGYTYNLGTTDDGGMVSANLPAGSYTFHVSYHGTSISYGPVDVTADSVTEHTFQTVNAQVNLQTCDGTGLSGGTVRYQSGGYWYYFGGTSPVPTDSNGAASWESFSGTFLIEMDYGGAATSGPVDSLLARCGVIARGRQRGVVGVAPDLAFDVDDALLQFADPGLELLDELTECATVGLKGGVARYAD